MSPLTVSLVRHGMTEGNKRGEFVGSTDQPVCPEGIEALLCYAGGYPEAETLFVSPMLRCRQTAELLYPGLTGVIVPDLKEQDFGRYERMTWNEILSLPGNENWSLDESGQSVFPDGERREDFHRRCIWAFREIAAQCAASGLTRAALVVHGGVIMTLMHSLCPPYGTIHDWWCANGHGYLVEWDGVTLSLIRRLGA